MSYSNFQNAMLKAAEFDDYSVGAPVEKEVLQKAEEKLNVHFSKILNEYLGKYGYVEFGGNEIFGIVKEDFDDLSVLEGCMVEYAVSERLNCQLPESWLPIYNFDDGYMGFLDFSRKNAEGEPPIIMAVYTGEKYIMVKKIADDLGDFLLDLANE